MFNSVWFGVPFVDETTSADAIVLLAGGIGESGEPGESYQEKVKRTVELYNQGYARNVIFCPEPPTYSKRLEL